MPAFRQLACAGLRLVEAHGLEHARTVDLQLDAVAVRAREGVRVRGRRVELSLVDGGGTVRQRRIAVYDPELSVYEAQARRTVGELPVIRHRHGHVRVANGVAPRAADVRTVYVRHLHAVRAAHAQLDRSAGRHRQVAHRRYAGNVLHPGPGHGHAARQPSLHECIAAQIAVADHRQAAEAAQSRRETHVVSVKVKRRRRIAMGANLHVQAPIRGILHRIGRIASLVRDAPVASGLQRAAVQSKRRTVLVRVWNEEPHDRAACVIRYRQHAVLFKRETGRVIGL